jgi:hypothetical protein
MNALLEPKPALVRRLRAFRRSRRENQDSRAPKRTSEDRGFPVPGAEAALHCAAQHISVMMPSHSLRAIHFVSSEAYSLEVTLNPEIQNSCCEKTGFVNFWFRPRRSVQLFLHSWMAEIPLLLPPRAPYVAAQQRGGNARRKSFQRRVI